MYPISERRRVIWCSCFANFQFLQYYFFLFVSFFLKDLLIILSRYSLTRQISNFIFMCWYFHRFASLNNIIFILIEFLLNMFIILDVITRSFCLQAVKSNYYHTKKWENYDFRQHLNEWPIFLIFLSFFSSSLSLLVSTLWTSMSLFLKSIRNNKNFFLVLLLMINLENQRILQHWSSF